MCLGTAMYTNEVETKEKYKLPEKKLTTTHTKVKVEYLPLST